MHNYKLYKTTGSLIKVRRTSKWEINKEEIAKENGGGVGGWTKRKKNTRVMNSTRFEMTNFAF